MQTSEKITSVKTITPMEGMVFPKKYVVRQLYTFDPEPALDEIEPPADIQAYPDQSNTSKTGFFNRLENLLHI
jgi:hypothetical protein